MNAAQDGGPKSRSGDVLISVQALRFIAAASVLLGHLEDSLRRGRIRGAEAVIDVTAMPWHAGVDIFFVVSGFIMFFMSAQNFGTSGAPGRFLERRIVRVVPLYWLFTTLMIAIIVLLPGKVVHDDLDPVHLVATYGFIPWPRADGEVQPLLSVGWTLNYEMFFYCVFAVALLFPRRIGVTGLAVTFVALSLIGWLAPVPGPLAAWTQPIILEFVYGVAIAALYVGGTRLSTPVRLALVIAGIALLFAGGQFGLKDTMGRFLLWGVPSALIASGFILGPDFARTRFTNAVKLGGDASYSLYLSHLFSLRAIGLVWPMLGVTNGWAFIIVAFVGSIIAAVAVYFVIEKPLLALMRRWIGTRRAGPALPQLSPR